MRNRRRILGVLPAVPPAELNPRQIAFAEDYAVNLNGTQAVIRAGYSKNGASVFATRLLADSRIKALVAELQVKSANVKAISADRLVRELVDLSLYDPAAIASTPMEGPQDIAKLPERVRRAIVGWGWDKHGNFTLKLSNKTTAIDMLARHLGMYRDKLEISGPDGAALGILSTGSVPPDEAAKVYASLMAIGAAGVVALTDQTKTVEGESSRIVDATIVGQDAAPAKKPHPTKGRPKRHPPSKPPRVKLK